MTFSGESRWRSISSLTFLDATTYSTNFFSTFSWEIWRMLKKRFSVSSTITLMVMTKVMMARIPRMVSTTRMILRVNRLEKE